MDILIYVIALFKFRKEIGINGLGTFYKQKTPGRYDAETHMFLPPVFTLSFSTTVKETNNLVAFIAKKRQISEDTAGYFISQFVDEIHKELANKGEYNLEGLGKLSNLGGDLTFHPTKEVNIGFDFFGLPPVGSEIHHIEATAEIAAANPEFQQKDTPIIETVEEAFLEGEQTTAEHQTPMTEEKNQTNATEEAQQKEAEIFAENRIEEENPGSFPEIETPEQPENEFENFVTLPELIIEEEIAHRKKDLDQQEVTNGLEEAVIVVENSEKTEPHLQDDWNFNSTREVIELEIEDREIQQSKSEIPKPQNFTGNQEIASELNDDNFNLGTSDAENNASKKSAVSVSEPSKDWDFDNEEGNTVITNETYALIEQTEEVEKRSMPIFVKALMVFLALAVAAIVLYFVNPNIFNAFVRNDTNPDAKIAVPIAEDNSLKNQTDSLTFADSIMNSAEKAGLKVDAAIDTLKVTTATKIINTTTYEVIAAALTTKEAAPFIAKLKRKGIVANIVTDMPGKLKKISIGSFNNPDSAQKYAAIYRKKFKDPQIYSIAVKHK